MLKHTTIKVFMINIKKFNYLNYWFIVLSVLYLALLMHLPVSIYTNAAHDDALFWTHAKEIAKGHWLGTFSQMTLPKGVGFSLFLFVNFAIGFPITLSIGLLNLLSSWFLAKTLLELNINKLIILVIFALIIFHPQLLPTRIIRDNIYSALTIISITSLIRVFYEKIFQDKFIKLFIYGIFFGLFWMTREEGIWILPALIFLISIRYYQIKNNKIEIVNTCKSMLILFGASLLFISSIASLNLIYYGKFELVDFKNNSFNQTLNTLNSVNSGAEIPYFPVPHEKRIVLYEVSPAFAELKNYFELEGRGWTIPGCTLYSNMCNDKADYAAGWFMWALRDAVASKGYYQNALTADNFYNRLNKEIINACEKGTLNCSTNIIPFMPKINQTQIEMVPDKIIKAVKILLLIEPINLTGGDSVGPFENFIRVLYFLGYPKTTQVLNMNGEDLILNGWYYSNKMDWFKVKCTLNNDIEEILISRHKSPDIAKIFNNENAILQHFSAKLPSNYNCSIYNNSSKFNGFQMPTTPLKKDFSIQKDDAILYIQANNNSINYDHVLKIKANLGIIYSYIIPIISIIGIICFFYNLYANKFKTTKYSSVYLISNIFWILVFSRVIILVLIEISAFNAINSLYMSTAFPMIIIASLLSLHESITKYFKKIS